MSTTRTTTTVSAWCAPESETAPYFSLQALYAAFYRSRQRKRHKVRVCCYEMHWLDALITTRDQLQNRTWQPAPPVVFCVSKPKAREVYAAQFQDRVVHHLVVPWLEAWLDHKFIADAASNRKGKGTHYAVDRAQRFMRQLNGKGYFLQLDIANFFNSINQSLLLELLGRQLHKQVKKRKANLQQARDAYWICQRIIRQPLAEQAIILGNAQKLEQVPRHKRLSQAPPDTGLPIGNLTSQFFANLYLNELDQWIKHELKVRFYIRYVDDFLLLHEDPAQLRHWHQQIALFLQQRLKLALKTDAKLAPCQAGADFLGYIIRPHYRLVRRRVVGNLHDKLQAMQLRLFVLHRPGLLDLPPSQRQTLHALLSSYWGHFNHAAAYRLKQRVLQRFPWLGWLLTPAGGTRCCLL